jgi:hypothetical protein
MKTSSRLGLTILFALILAPIAKAQTEPEEGQQASSVRAGTEMTARLESALDARTAKPGDEVAARVTKDVKQDGKTVVRKGDRLLGRVTSAEAAGDANSRSAMTVEFDRLARGSTTSSLHTVISAVVSTPAEQRAAFERAAAEPAMPPPPVRGASGGGGLLGGAASTIGSTVGATAGATGSVLGGVGEGLDATARNTAESTAGISLATPARSIQVASEGKASQSGASASALRTDQGLLRLESGTMLEFRVASETAAEQKTE